MKQPKPQWLKVSISGSAGSRRVETLIRDLKLNTVCREANCPNRMECFERRTATFMILGSQCTRNCTFCNVSRGEPTPIDIEEPNRLAEAVETLDLRHAVITSVTRDDLPDGGASHFAAVVEAIRARSPKTSIELLIPDLKGNWAALSVITRARPDVLNHNIETVPELYPSVRPDALFERSLELLRTVKAQDPSIVTKSGVMLGLGETAAQVRSALSRLRETGCDMLTIGQYLQPSPKHLPMVEYVHPDVFADHKHYAMQIGYRHVASGPLVRSSYHAEQSCLEAELDCAQP